MKKLVLGTLIALMLVAAVATPVLADDITATVTVTEFASVTIADQGSAGLSFGSLNPGTVKQAETASPSVIVTAADENNIDVTIEIKGTDFTSGGNTLAIGNAYWDDDSDGSDATPISTTEAVVATLSATESVGIYHWLTIPDTQAAGTYTSTFTYSN